ncbi:hypothetical protein HYV84_04795, partial [Candidatus Woesearchaeota archaeon]|nr:hypothetical protein [Candidatus Woesearchaeota archaeon]
MSGKSSVPSILPLKIALFLVIVMLTPLVLGIHECTSTQNPYPIHKTLSVGGSSENVFDSGGKLISACCRQPTDCVPFSGSCLSEGWVVDVRSPPGTPDICKGSVWKNPDETRELCDQVEKKQPGRPRETDPLFEMVDGRSTFVGCCQDDTGEYSTKCQQPGASADVNCGPNGNTIRCCSPDLLEAGVEKKDPGERFCVIEDFGGFTCKVPKKVHQFGADGKFFFCSDGLWLDVDADKTGAQCKSVQGLKWAIGGEINDCCGDDVGQEFSRTCDIDSQNANADSQTTSNCAASAPAKIGACCDKASDCVDQAGACKTAGNCFPLGQSGKLSFCRETVSLTNTPVGVWEDPDKERSFCEAPGCNSGIPFKFGLTGSKGGGKCCGDDEGENIRECKDQSDNGDCSSTPTQQVFACCGPADCVDEKGQCRASGGLYLFGNQPDISSPQKKSFCDNGIWKDPDDIGAGCTPPFVYGIPQEAQPNLPASTGCCGDDANEFANSKLCQTGVCTANTNDRACCDAQKDCVSNGKCITDKDMFDIDNDGDKELCNLGKWEDADQNLQNCNKHDMNPSPVAFMAGAVCGRGDCNEITATGTAADSSFCCGDDEFELPFPGNNQVCFRSNTSRSPETLDCFKNSRYYKNGDFIGDEICENGNFTSRTKAIAAALLELANKTSPKNFTLFCDSYENALNYLNYPARGTDIALRFFDG